VQCSAVQYCAVLPMCYVHRSRLLLSLCLCTSGDAGELMSDSTVKTVKMTVLSKTVVSKSTVETVHTSALVPLFMRVQGREKLGSKPLYVLVEYLGH